MSTNLINTDWADMLCIESALQAYEAETGVCIDRKSGKASQYSEPEIISAKQFIGHCDFRYTHNGEVYSVRFAYDCKADKWECTCD